MKEEETEPKYTMGQQVKVSGEWYHVIDVSPYMDGSVKVHEDPGNIDRSKPMEDVGLWMHQHFIEDSRPAPSGVKYTRRGIGYKAKYMRDAASGQESYIITEHETGEEVGQYIHATEQSAEIELEEMLEDDRRG